MNSAFPFLTVSIVVALCLAPAALSSVLERGLLGYYPLDGTPEDASGNGHHGVEVGGIAYVEGVRGLAADFDGAISEHIRVDGFPEISGSLTISAWFQPRNLASNFYNPIVTRGFSAEETYTLWVSYARIVLMLNWASGETQCQAPATVGDDRFYHVAAVYDFEGHEMILYFEGERVGGCEYFEPLDPQTEPLFFSSSYPGGKDFFRGSIDEIRIYDRALGPCEIRALAHLTPGTCEGIDDENVLFVNGVTGIDECYKVSVESGHPLYFTMQKPSGGGRGRFVAHLNLGWPRDDTLTELPARVGTACFPLLIPPYGTADPAAVWSNLQRPDKVGASAYFGSPIPDPAKAPTTFLALPVGDTTRLPPGTRVTLQGVIHNPAASSPKRASLTNPVVLQFR